MAALCTAQLGPNRSEITGSIAPLDTPGVVGGGAAVGVVGGGGGVVGGGGGLGGSSGGSVGPNNPGNDQHVGQAGETPRIPATHRRSPGRVGADILSRHEEFLCFLSSQPWHREAVPRRGAAA